MGKEAEKFRVLHLIQQMTLGGAARALVATSKYSSQYGPYIHEVISLVPSTPEGRALADEAGVVVHDAPERHAILKLIEASDIVHINWWNNGQLQRLLRSELPKMRSLVWYHVAGDNSPQLITPSIAGFPDINIATNPYTHEENPVFQELRANGRADRVRMILDPADLARVKHVKPVAHQGFNVGYIGTVDFYKMHPQFIEMSSSVDIPGVQFLVCGGGIEDQLREKARALGTEGRFQFLGYVKDICPVISQLDVYGYPLCEMTYASGELNLQEVMACGVPPVVFPYGGVKRIIKDRFNGLIVHTEDEYREALEFLYHNPVFRKELGQNARETALREYGAENAANTLNNIYSELLSRPKRRHVWGLDWSESMSLVQSDVVYSCPLSHGLDSEGAETFCESLADEGKVFRVSAGGHDVTLEESIAADIAISRKGSFIHDVGIQPYLGEFSDDARLHYWSGLMWAARDDWDKSIQEFSLAVQHGWLDIRVHALIALASSKSGNTNLLGLARENVSKFPHAQQICVESLVEGLASRPEVTSSEKATCPDGEDVDALLKDGRWAEASSLLTEIWEKHGDSVAIFESLAACSIETGDLDGASRWLSMAIQLPDCPPMDTFQLARVEHARGKSANALKWAREYLELEKEPVDDFWAFAGELEFEHGSQASAMHLLGKAVQVQPENWHASLVLCHCLMRSGEKDAALDMARNVSARNPEYQPVIDFLRLHSDSSEDVVQSAEQKSVIRKRIEEIERTYNGDTAYREYHLYKLLEEFPASPEVLLSLGVFELKLGRLKAARRHLDRLVQLDPTSQDGWTYLAQVHLAGGNGDGLEKCLEKALALNPENADANHLLALMYIETENYIEAARIFHALISKYPDEKEYCLGLRRCFENLNDPDTLRSIDERLLEYDSVMAAENGNIISADGNIVDVESRGVVANIDSSVRIVDDSHRLPEIEEVHDGLTQVGHDIGGEEGMAGQPLVSVIVSTYNNEDYLRACLDDLVAQTIFDQCEIIIIDSGSEQDEQSIAREFTSIHSNIKYFRTERESLYISWNRGLKLARGKYITNANTDDAHRKDAFEILTGALEADPEAMLAYGNVIWTDRANDTFDSPSVVREVRYPEFDPIHVMTYCPMGCHPMWRRETFDLVGEFSSDYKVVGDYEFLYRFVKAGLKAVRVPEFLSLFYQNQLGLSHKNQGHDNEITRLQDHYRENIPIGRIVRLPSGLGKNAAEARGWAALGTALARGIAVPWHETPVENWGYATSCLEKAIQLDPDFWPARVNLCYLCGQTENQQLLDQHIRLIPENKRRTAYICIKARMPLWEPCILRKPHEPSDPPPESGLGEKSSVSLSIPLRWHGPLFNESGFASEAHMFLFSLWQHGIKPSIHNIGYKISDGFLRGMPASDRSALMSMRDAYSEARGGIILQTGDTNLEPLTGADYLVGRVMFETDRLPSSWVLRCIKMDELWVTGKPQYEAYLNSGVPEEKLYILNGAVDERLYDPEMARTIDLKTGTTYNFFAVFEWIHRKGWDLMFEAYFRNFDIDDDVTLLIRTYVSGLGRAATRVKVHSAMDRIARKVGKPKSRLPRVRFIEEVIPGDQFASYYKSVDCMLSPSRGEGWGRPQQEAMLMGLPVIATGWGGSMEFMSPETNYLIDYKLEPVRGVESVYWDYTECRWALPDVEHFGALMRHVFTHRDEARETGQRARQYILDNFSRSKVTEQLLSHLSRIDETVRAGKSFRGPWLPVKPETSHKGRINLCLEGSFLDFGSLSKVNRQLSHALAKRQDINFSRSSVCETATNTDEMLVKHGMTTGDFRRNDKVRNQFCIRHCWPPNWSRLSTGHLIMMQPWEFGKAPVEWVNYICGNDVSELWAYSRAVRDAYIDAGVPPEKIRVVPLGVDTNLYSPDGEKMDLGRRQKTRFLFVGGTIHRKGPDILLDAYLNQFSDKDDVCLIIKDFGGGSVYEGQTLGEQIQIAQQKGNAPEIIYLDQEMSEMEMASLYRSCDCLVHPYRGEGFGLPVIEAMACGLPVIVTGGGSTDDFVDENAGWKIRAVRKNIGDMVSRIPLVGDGWLLEPDQDSLMEAMREAHENHPERIAKGKQARCHVEANYDWAHCADRVASALHEISQKIKDDEKQQRTAPRAVGRKLELPPVAFVGRLEQATLAFDAGKFVDAWTGAVDALKVRPFHPDAYLLLARICSQKGDFQRGREILDKVRSMAPDYRPAKSLSKKFRKQGAGHAMDRGVFIDPGVNPLLSVCLITKNEEKNITRCLESVAGIANEIIVVDTGSTDKTIEVAREFGAIVEEVHWEDDFSAPRNKALELATGQWVLVLDADEELPAESHAVLLHDLKCDEAMAYRLPISDIGREEDGVNFVPRLFRNAPGLFYVGRIHEQVFSSVEVRRREWGLEYMFSDAAIHHYGYSEEATRDRDKINRNLRLLEMALEEMPGEPNLLMNLGLELCRGGNPNAGIKYYLQAFKAAESIPPDQLTPEIRETLMNQISTYLLKTGAYSEIISLAGTRLGKSAPLSASTLFIVGLACMESGDHENAVHYFRECINARDRKSYASINPEVKKGGPFHCMGMSFEKLEKYPEALDSYVEALALSPDSSSICQAVYKLATGKGLHIQAIQSLNRVMFEGEKSIVLWNLGAEICRSNEQTLQFGLEWTTEALKFFPENKELIESRIHILVECGELAKMMSCFASGHEGAMDRKIFAGIVWARLIDGQPLPQISPQQEKPVSHELLGLYRSWVSRGYEPLIRKINDHLDELESAFPSAARPLIQVMAELA